jgi:threonylcarbamoyladenosine tRNA methylthiotransferase MtaB
MFANSLSVIDACDLTYLHVFPFSPRENTPAARMPQVPRAVVKERAARLRDKGASVLSRFLAMQAGSEVEVLMEREDIGRTRQFAEIHLRASGLPGGVVRARVNGHDGRRLSGEVLA